MPHKSYSEKLRDPRWQKLRLHVLERAGWTCEGCKAKDKTLFVHHGYYARGADPWDYDPQTLWSLCEDCHEQAEAQRQDFLYESAFLHPFRLSPDLVLSVRRKLDDKWSIHRGCGERFANLRRIKERKS